jgi:hypothetical protein
MGAITPLGLNVRDTWQGLIEGRSGIGRIIQSAVRTLGIPPDRVFTNLARYGNTSSAPVAMALAEAIEDGRVQKRDLVVSGAFGAGLAWAATALEWSLPWPVPKPPRWRSSWRRCSSTWPDSSPGSAGFGAGSVPGSGDWAKVRRSSPTSSRPGART